MPNPFPAESPRHVIAVASKGEASIRAERPGPRDLGVQPGPLLRSVTDRTAWPPLSEATAAVKVRYCWGIGAFVTTSAKPAVAI